MIKSKTFCKDSYVLSMKVMMVRHVTEPASFGRFATPRLSTPHNRNCLCTRCSSINHHFATTSPNASLYSTHYQSLFASELTDASITSLPSIGTAKRDNVSRDGLVLAPALIRQGCPRVVRQTDP